jgi:hypothetical protein
VLLVIVFRAQRLQAIDAQAIIVLSVDVRHLLFRQQDGLTLAQQYRSGLTFEIG